MVSLPIISSFLLLLFPYPMISLVASLSILTQSLLLLLESDGSNSISLLFVLLNCLLLFLCLISSWSFPPLFHSLFIFMAGLVNLVFLTDDLLIFYISFEMVLIPMFLLIGYYGSRERKIRASYFFFRYTLLFSVPFRVALLSILSQYGSLHMDVLPLVPYSHEYLLFIAFFLSFAVKVPMFPLHIWLPEAHVEAPTAGSVYLAGILLKLGTYGLLQWCLPLFPSAILLFTPIIISLCLIAIVYASLTAIRQTDMKRVIAYASVAHMNITLLGLFSTTVVGLSGSIFQMLAHGVVSGALFLCVGVLYDRYHTRLIPYYGGMVSYIPLFSSLFLLFTIANIALPGTANFTGEFLIMLGIMKWNTVALFFSSTGLVLGGAYSLFLFNRVVFGTSKLPYSPDLTHRELASLIPLSIITLWMGLSPQWFLDLLDLPSYMIIYND